MENIWSDHKKHLSVSLQDMSSYKNPGMFIERNKKISTQNIVINKHINKNSQATPQSSHAPNQNSTEHLGTPATSLKAAQAPNLS